MIIDEGANDRTKAFIASKGLLQSENDILNVAKELYEDEVKWYKENNDVRTSYFLNGGLCRLLFFIEDQNLRTHFDNNNSYDENERKNLIYASQGVKRVVEEVVCEYNSTYMINDDIFDEPSAFYKGDHGVHFEKPFEQNIESLELRLELIEIVRNTVNSKEYKETL